MSNSNSASNLNTYIIKFTQIVEGWGEFEVYGPNLQSAIEHTMEGVPDYIDDEVSTEWEIYEVLPCGTERKVY